MACQLFYALGTAAVLAITAMPASVQQPLTQYGARDTVKPPGNKAGATACESNGNVFPDLIVWVASTAKVPHSWFRHFYILSVFGSVFWAVQFLRRGALIEIIIAQQDLGSESQSSMSSSQVILAWFLMALQGWRRAYECYAVMRPSSSRMLVLHWLLGIGFYLVTSIGIWVEGSGG